MLRADPSSPLRVLVIDHRAEQAAFFSNWLRNLSCKTSVGFDARGGVRLSELFRPALVFINLGLPDGAAATVRSEIQRILGSRTPLFIGLDEMGSLRENAQCRELGFDGIVKPPIESQALHQILEAAVVQRDESWERSLTGRRLEARTSAAHR